MENEERENEKEKEEFKKRIIAYTSKLERYKDLGTPNGEMYEERRELNESLRDLTIEMEKYKEVDSRSERL